MDCLQEIIESERLPASFEKLALDYYVPLARQVSDWRNAGDAPFVLGVNGAQGTGKSTMSLVLAKCLEAEFGHRVAVLSIDDLYLTKADRRALGDSVHPLLRTRGVPGTHDAALGLEIIDAVKRGEPVRLPRFDKSVDDRVADGGEALEEIDILIFEGWCVGALPEASECLADPINTLEADEDASGAWRSYVNDQLAGSYAALFASIDRLAMLKAPDFECVHEWRGEQEAKLCALQSDASACSGLMNEAELHRFIMHYERLTRWMFREMPERADVTFELSPEHTIVAERGLA